MIVKPGIAMFFSLLQGKIIAAGPALVNAAAAASTER
jgi:hypothetical protein